MKTIILYATKHGTAAEVARRIADKTGGGSAAVGDSATVVCDLKQGGIPSIDDFDCVIIGSSLYAGAIRWEAKDFLAKNIPVLQKKKLGLFLCGLDAKGEKTYFDNNFPPDLIQKAQTVHFLGGIFDPKKNNFFERLIIKIVSKQSGYINTIDDAKIEQFGERMRNY